MVEIRFIQLNQFTTIYMLLRLIDDREKKKEEKKITILVRNHQLK